MAHWRTKHGSYTSSDASSCSGVMKWPYCGHKLVNLCLISLVIPPCLFILLKLYTLRAKLPKELSNCRRGVAYETPSPASPQVILHEGTQSNFLFQSNACLMTNCSICTLDLITLSWKKSKYFFKSCTSIKIFSCKVKLFVYFLFSVFLFTFMKKKSFSLCRNYDLRKGGSSVMLWKSKTSDCDTGDHCLFPVSHQRSTLLNMTAVTLGDYCWNHDDKNPLTLTKW